MPPSAWRTSFPEPPRALESVENVRSLAFPIESREYRSAVSEGHGATRIINKPLLLLHAASTVEEGDSIEHPVRVTLAE
ncbi:hypothetical protein MTO96_020797 [Rhipicephalus appendiculatus]